MTEGRGEGVWGLSNAPFYPNLLFFVHYYNAATAYINLSYMPLQPLPGASLYIW